MNWITDEIVELIMQTKSKLPPTWKIVTVEKELYLSLVIENKVFSEYSLHEKIAIAEAMNQLQEEIRKTGCPCWIDNP